MRAHSRRNDSGFTLIELVVVIGLVVVLIAILLPVVTMTIEHARSAKCLSNLRQIGVATKIYTNNNNDTFPYSGREWPYAGFIDIFGQLGPSITDKNVFLCPSDPDPPWNVFWTVNYGPYFGFSNPAALPFPASYYYVYPFYHADFDCNGNPGPLAPARVSQVKFPTRKVIFTCYARQVQGGGHLGGDALNLLFVDGHCQTVNWTDILLTIPYSQNLDWTQCGIRGYDTNGQ